MTQRTLRIAYAAVDGGRDYGEAALGGEEDRYQNLLGTVAAVADEGLDLLVFPAGYFRVTTARARAALVRRLRRGLRAAAPAFGIVVGIDQNSSAPEVPEAKKSRTARQHPFLAVYRTRSGQLVTMQQVSVNRREGALLDVVEARWGARALLLAQTPIAFLLCGESWSDDLLERVVASNCRVLVIAAHRTVNMHTDDGGWANLSWHHRLQEFTDEHQIPVVLAEHTRSPNRHPYSWPADISRELALDGVPDRVTLRLATIKA